MKKFISIAGNIGSGKSSLTELLAKDFNWIPYYESVSDNPYLEDFYSDMHRWSFNLQIYFLSHRFRIHKEIIERKESVIQDRSIYEDVEIFAENLYKLGRMSERDYANYKNLFAEMVSYLQPPDLLVYLRANTQTLKNQIKLRGRDFEKNIESSYLESLNSSYEKWMSEYNYGDSIIINTDNLDFVNSTDDLNYIKSKIEASLK
ncbi:MAG TPA: deoxynucleoside kinase [Bacteroidetes bacterium]|nr:deoxynucleoside kinase [Bacteroidota bacterium]HCN38182.1 deoxynucleoside kinase [Bacteroidota bacterium]